MHTQQSTSHYVKIWGILLVLLFISICGPMLGFRPVTLITAFGVAVIKANLVAANFMHLKIEKKIISYLLLAILLIVVVFFFGVASDILMPGGENWEHLIK